MEVGFYHCHPKHIVALILYIHFPEPCTCGKGEKKPKRNSNGLEEAPSTGDVNEHSVDWHIAHGEEVEDPEKYYPWIVFLDNGCTGARLDPLHVLTAAHCISEEVKKDASALKAYKGNDRVYFMSVAKTHVHPSYKEAEDAGKAVGEAVQSSSDIAVVMLKTGKLENAKGEELDRNTTPICLPTKAESEWIGEVPLAAGFGVDENGEEQDKLRGARVKIVNHEDCNKKREGWNKKIKR